MNSGTETVSPKKRRAWRDTLLALRNEPAHSRILGGSLVMLFGSSLVSVVNFGYNIAVARLLGPAAFGHAAAAVTLLMLVSAITLSFQLVCAKFVARNTTVGGKSAVYAKLLRRAWIVGILLGSALCLAAGPVAQYLRLPSPTLVIVLASGIAFYVPLGVRRGGFQGVCAFSRLTTNFILEALVKFGGAIVLMELGYGVLGAVEAIAASVVLAYFLPPTPAELKGESGTGQPASFREGIQAIVFFVGQVVINNIDILLVKHFFAPDQAGLYAAVALVGRVVYMLAWSVVSAMFPISAGARREERSSVLVVALGFVVSIALAFTLGVGLFPDFTLGVVFGSGFQAAGYRLDSLLMLYAAATGAYSLAVVLMAYEMSRKLANSGWVQLSFSGMIVAGIGMFHSSLRQVIVVQLVLMVLLLIAAAVPFFKVRVVDFEPIASREPASQEADSEASGLRRIRRVAEPEIIAGFLRNEFHHPEFNHDRNRFSSIVVNADTGNEAENALRRALLFRRRGTMWRELPPDTEWYEVELSVSDVEKLRVFPRAQWRKLASGSFLLTDIVARIREDQFKGRTADFIRRIRRFSDYLTEHAANSVILLIGINEEQPLTVIEGNHRVTAAALASTQLAHQRFRFFCGFSPRMTECCWYQTNLATLYRYARNRLKILIYDREADIAHLLTLLHESRQQSEDVSQLSPSPNAEPELQPRQVAPSECSFHPAEDVTAGPYRERAS
jgi:O-antigen/teichoic acid export membrane protein